MKVPILLFRNTGVAGQTEVIKDMATLERVTCSGEDRVYHYWMSHADVQRLSRMQAAGQISFFSQRVLVPQRYYSRLRLKYLHPGEMAYMHAQGDCFVLGEVQSVVQAPAQASEAAVC